MLQGPRPDPIFVLGHQKSGTTAVAALLSEATERTATLDILEDHRNRDFCRVLGSEMPIEDYVSRYPVAFRKCIIKEPNLTLMGPQLAERFPDARWVMVIRDPVQNIRSLLDRVGVAGDLDHLDGDAIRALQAPWNLLFEHPTGDADWPEHYIDQLAERWCLFAQVTWKMPTVPIVVRYEDFSKDKQGCIESLANELGETVRVDIASRVDIARQPAGARRMRPEADVFGNNLARIHARCADVIRKLESV